MSEFDSHHGVETEGLQEQKNLSEGQDFLLPSEIQEKLKSVELSEEQQTLFEDFLKQNSEKKALVFEAIKQSDPFYLSLYIMDNGFIINDTHSVTYNKFMEKFGENILAKNKIREKETDLQKTQNIIEFKKIFPNEVIAELSGNYKDLIQQIVDEENESGKTTADLFTELVNHREFDNLIADLQRIDAEKGLTGTKESTYESFKNYILENNDTPEIREQFVKYDQLIPRKLDASPRVYQAQITAALGSEKFERRGSILQRNKGDTNIQVDLSKNPPTRSLALSESGYRLPTELPLSNFYQVVEKEGLQYDKTYKKNTPQIEKLETSEQKIAEYLGDERELEKQNLPAIKKTLEGILGEKIYKALGIEHIDSKENLKDTLQPKMKNLLKELQKELKKIEKEYEKALSKQVRKYKKQMEKQDESIEKNLKLLNSLGLDRIPQLDQILGEIQSNRLTIDLGIGFDVKNINLSEGNFGEPRNITNSQDAFVENLVRFANKIYYGNAEGKDSVGEQVGFRISDFKSNSESIPKTWAQLSSALKNQGILSENETSFDITKIRENLKKPNEAEK